MGLAIVQSALARLFTDASLRAKFFADPTAVGITLVLDESEIKQLAELIPTRVNAFANSLYRKRRDDLAKALPLSCKALSSRYAAAFDRFAAKHAFQDRESDVQAFVSAVRIDCVETPWLSDLVSYEATFRDVSKHWIVRWYRYPVGRLANALFLGNPVQDVHRQRTLAVWFRWRKRGKLRHFVVAGIGPRWGLPVAPT